MSTPTAGDITVHRCVVRVIRRGGWSWGPAPRDLVRQVVNALPGLLAARFAEPLSGAGAVGDSETVEITEPVTVTVRWGQPGGWSLDELTADVVVEAAGVPVVPQEEERPVASPSRQVPVSASPAELFAGLARHDELVPLLALLPAASLRTYLIAVLADAAADSPVAPETGVAEAARVAVTVADLVVAEYARRVAPRPVPAARTDLLRELRSAAADAVPIPVPPATGMATADPEVLVPAETTTSEPGTVQPGTTTAVAPIGVEETRTCGALPFLLAGALARTGYLAAIGPALAGVDLLAEAPLFAAALAYKVLGAPARGWRRTRADHATAAAFAGLDDVPDLAAFEHRARHALPVLDGLVALGVSRGHDPADPLLIAGMDDEMGGGLLLVDAQGMFPVAWSPDAAGVLPHWIACGRPPVAVCDSPLPADCLRVLATAGMDLVTDVRPLRDDPLTRLPRPAPLWTAGNPDPRLVAALPSHAGRLTELVSAFTTRRAVPRSDDGTLDRSTLLAAGTGLGLIAWVLWHDRETSGPVLALTRFADLEVTVRYRAGSVHVRLPLGRRHADLLNNGMLADVPDVVWLGGRPLTFSGG